MEQLKWVALLYEIVLEGAKSTASQDYTLKRSKGENYHFHISYEPKVGSRLSLLWMHRLQLRFNKGINREAWEKRKRSETWAWGKGCHLTPVWKSKPSWNQAEARDVTKILKTQEDLKCCTSIFFFCSEFCHTLKWNSHGFTCVPHPDPPSHLPLHPLPLGLPSAPGPSTCLMHPTWAGDLFHPR